MHVVFLTQTMNVQSGWGRYALEVVTRMRRRGLKVTVLVEQPSGDPDEQVILTGSISSLPHALLSSFRVRSFIKKADVIHALDAYPYGLIAALANLGVNKPLVMSAVATYAVYPLMNRRLRPFMKWAYRQADIITPITNYTGEIISGLMTALPPIERVMLGVDANVFRLDERKNNVSPYPYFLSVGALKKRKGYHYVIPALAEIKKDCPTAKYVIVGDTADKPYVSHLHELIKKHDVADMVEIKGLVSEEDLRNLYAGCVSFILIPENRSAFYAGFHLVFLEANALGKPVISGQGFGAEEVVRDGYNGFLITPGDTASLVKRMSSLVMDESLRQQMRVDSRALAVSYNWEKMVDGYLAVYGKAINFSNVKKSRQ